MLLHHGVTPVMVFDGAELPSKKGTEVGRKSSREEFKAKGMEALRADNRSAATEYFQRAVDITPRMAYRLIKALRKLKVECIVAPYEADAQLAYLNIQGFVQAVISEDSDIVAFGAETVFFKMDRDGNGQEYRKKLLGACDKVRLSGWEHERFLQMCIFAGCDYLKSLQGLGIKRAHSIIQGDGSLRTAPEECYIKALAKLRLDGTLVPSTYQEDFRKAYLTFRHQLVFDPEQECLVPIRPVPPELSCEDLSFAGIQIPCDVAQGIARGDLDPTDHLPFESNSKANPETCSPEIIKPAQKCRPTAKSLMKQAAIPNCQQTSILKIFGRISGVSDSEKAPAARGVVAPNVALTVSADAARDFRPPRAVSAGLPNINDIPSNEDSHGADFAANDGTDDAAEKLVGDESSTHSEDAIGTKRPRRWTANPFVNLSKKLLSVEANKPLQDARPNTLVTSKFFASSKVQESVDRKCSSDLENCNSPAQENMLRSLQFKPLDHHTALERFAYNRHPASTSCRDEQDQAAADSPDPAADSRKAPRFSSHLLRPGTGGSGAPRLSLRPHLPSFRAVPARPMQLELLAFRRN